MDAEAPDNILEVTARALTYYLDVSADCTRRIVAVDGALKAIIERMRAADMKQRASKDLAEQCVKVRGVRVRGGGACRAGSEEGLPHCWAFCVECGCPTGVGVGRGMGTWQRLQCKWPPDVGMGTRLCVLRLQCEWHPDVGIGIWLCVLRLQC